MEWVITNLTAVDDNSNAKWVRSPQPFLKMTQAKTQTKTTYASKMGFFERLGWKFYLWKLQLYCAKLDRQTKKARKKYCRYGYHKLRSCGISFGGTGQRMKHIRFLKCLHCNYKFFAKKSDKERYMKHKKLYDDRLKNSFSAMLKHSSSAKPKHS